MKSYILLLGLLLGGFTAYADSTAKKETEAILIGHVVDSRSGEHLPFITITVKGTTIGTTTDVSGHYLLGNLPVGRPLTVVAQSVGYKSAERSVTLGAHSTTELNFELEEQAVDVGEVVVEIDRDDAELPEGSMFIQDLIGLPVLCEGKTLGKVKEILQLPANDVYVVEGEQEYMIPAVPEFILERNPDEGFIRVRLLEGMQSDAV